MNLVKVLFLSVVISAAAMGCAKKDMPTAEQKAQLKSVSESAARAQGAVPQKKETAPRSLFEVAKYVEDADTALRVIDQVVPQFSASGERSTDELRTQMSNRLQSALDDKDCTLTADTESASSGSVSVSLKGEKCPVEFEMEASGSASEASSGGAALSMSVKYSVKDEEYRKLNDVDSVNLSLSFSVQASESSGTISANIDSRIHSQKYGDLVETGKGSGTITRDSGDFELVVTDTFATFSIERKIRIESQGRNSKPKTTYQVNGNDVSESEFKSYTGTTAAGGSLGEDSPF